jgi:hypothetical protein
MNLGTKLEPFKGWQSKVDQMSKSSSPRGCIWHVDQVIQTLDRLRPGIDWPARVWGGSDRALVATRLHKEEKPESVEKVDGGRSTRPIGHTAWPPDHHLALNWLIQIGGDPIRPYKYPLVVKIDTHTPHFWDYTCKALILSLVVGRNLIERVARLLGPEGLPTYWEPSS